MKAPCFTVLIDAYNYGEYIEKAVSSALAQDFPAEEREILVVDDGSTDDTQERLRKLGEMIRYLRKPNGGQASAFNFGFANARGEVIARRNADDVWMPAKLERVYEESERHPAAGMVYHRVHLWNGVSDIFDDTYFIPISGRVTGNRRPLLQYPMVGTFCLAFRSKPVPGKCGASATQPDRTQNGHPRGASRGDPELAAKAWRGYELSRNSWVLPTMGESTGEQRICLESAEPLEIRSPPA